jgi:hypothetical protein
MASKICLDYADDLKSKRILDSSKFWSKKLFTPKLGACVDTVFLEKRVKKDKEKQPMKNRVQSADGRERKGWSKGFADGQRISTLSKGLASQPIGRWSTRGLTDG